MSPRFIRREKGSGAGSAGDGDRGAKPTRLGSSRFGAPRPGGAFKGPKPEWRADAERGGEWGGAGRRDGPRPEGSRYEPRRFEGRRPDPRKAEGSRFAGRRSEGRRPEERPYEGGRPFEGRSYGARSNEGGGEAGPRPQSRRPAGERFKAPRPDRFGSGADRPLGRRPGGERPYGDRPQGRRFEKGTADAQRDAGSWGEGARPGGARPFGARPAGARAFGARPGGDRTLGGRPQGRGADGRPGERPFTTRPGRGPDRNSGARPERFGQAPQESPTSEGEAASGSDRFGAAPADDLIWGRHSAQAALESERPIHRIWCTPELRFSPKFLQLLRESKASGVLVEEVTWARLGQLTGGAVHQGIVLQTAAAETFALDDLIEGCRSLEEPALLMAVDGLTDPHNLGAIVRSAEALGAHGLVLPQRRSAGLTGSVAKVAAGALEHLPVARVVNLNRSLDTLKQEGYRVIGLAEEGSVTLMEADLDGPLVLVTGSEGEGLSMLTRKHCDQLVRIPLRGVTPSLNASVATALLLYELARRGWMRQITGSAPAPRLRRPQLRTRPASTAAPAVLEGAAEAASAPKGGPLAASVDGRDADASEAPARTTASLDALAPEPASSETQGLNASTPGVEAPGVPPLTAEADAMAAGAAAQEAPVIQELAGEDPADTAHGSAVVPPNGGPLSQGAHSFGEPVTHGGNQPGSDPAAHRASGGAELGTPSVRSGGLATEQLASTDRPGPATESSSGLDQDIRV